MCESENTIAERGRQANIQVSNALSLASVLSRLDTQDEEVLSNVSACREIHSRHLEDAYETLVSVTDKVRFNPDEVVTERQAEIVKKDRNNAEREAKNKAETDEWLAARDAERAKGLNTSIPEWKTLDTLGYVMKNLAEQHAEGSGPGHEIIKKAGRLAERIDKLIKKPQAEGQTH